jgi:hypothetical protein
MTIKSFSYQDFEGASGRYRRPRTNAGGLSDEANSLRSLAAPVAGCALSAQRLIRVR